MKSIRIYAMMALALAGGCSSDLLRYRTKMWHQCQADLVGQQRKYASSLETKRGLEKRVGRLQVRLQACQKDREALKTSLAQLRKQLALRRAAIVELERRAARIRAQSEVYARLASRLRSMIDAGNLKVTIRKGRMILNLPNEILFDAGRAKLKEAGKRALEQLARVLKEFSGRDFLVAGHTDNVPVHHSRYRSNWQLSVARALEVVEFLQQSGMDPRHLAAAGFSEYDPVADNGTEEGRARNRRIEIVVMPKVSELPALPPQSAAGRRVDVSAPESSPSQTRGAAVRSRPSAVGPGNAHIPAGDH